MDYQSVRTIAREKMQKYCKVCPTCDGRACFGQVPGMGGTGTGSAFKVNVESLAQYRLNMRTIHNAKSPDTSKVLFDKTLKTPILAAPITGSSYNMGGALTEEEYAKAVVDGSKEAGTIAMTGDGADPTMYKSGVDAIKGAEGWGIAIIKPREQEEILKRIAIAEEAGAMAVGMDICGAGLITMALKGQPVGPKTFEEIKKLVDSTSLPFILKGIMSVEEAKMAADAGVAAIVVSNHGGRVLDYTPGGADVLPEIAEAVKGKVTVLADGGIRSGVDVLKMLALGADVVLVGRPVIVGAFGGHAEGVKIIIDKMTNELLQAMILTGCPDIASINSSVVTKK